MRGPIDFIVVAFKGNKFNGGIIKALEKAVNDGVVAVLDLSLFTKDASGTVTTIELSDLGDETILEFTQTNKLEPGLVNEDDVDEVGELLENDSAAGLLVIEHLWAKDLKKAILDANGELIAEGRIHPEASAELEK